MTRTYIESFEQGPGGWYGWVNNALGPRALELKDGYAVSRSPWWIDYNHAPPGAGYLHLPFMLNTRGKAGEHLREVAGENRFITGGFPTDFTNAKITLKNAARSSGGAKLVLLIQAVQGPICSGWLLTGQPFTVTPEFSLQTAVASPDESEWTCLGSRHDRTDFYGKIDLRTVLSDVNTNILLVFYPLDIAPMGKLKGDPHKLRPEKDYPVWRSKLPEGYLELDEVKIEFAG